MSENNPVEALFKHLSDQELAEGVKEAFQWRETGYIPAGLIRDEWSQGLKEILPLPVSSIYSMVAEGVFREASRRWLASVGEPLP